MNKILIANRGEVARRIIKTCNKLSIKSVALFTSSDENSPYTLEATQKIKLGLKSNEFLNIPKILKIAKAQNCDAIHPGYGFISENFEFAKAVEESNLIFIGPRSSTLKELGSKKRAKNLAQKSKVKTLAGFPIKDNLKKLRAKSKNLKYPLLIKASFGGGGKGMKLIQSKEELENAIELARSEAQQYFGNSELILEEYLPSARHIEVQSIVDNFGNILNLGTRECSIQRNNQKIIEEAPAKISKKIEKKLIEAANKIARAAKLKNATTFEFLLDSSNDEFYFLEANTRLQVEHTVTEQIYGIDIIELQIKIAQGKDLFKILGKSSLKSSGHSIQCRICAEDTTKNFTPTVGQITKIVAPKIKGIRVEHSLARNSKVTYEFDSMICKVIASGDNREECVKQLTSYLQKFSIKADSNFTTNQNFIINILSQFNENTLFTTNFIKENLDILNSSIPLPIILQILAAYKNEHNNQLSGIKIEVQSQNHKPTRIEGAFNISKCGEKQLFKIRDYKTESYVLPRVSHLKAIEGNFTDLLILCGKNEEKYLVKTLHKNLISEVAITSGEILAPLPGQIVDVFVSKSDAVEIGQKLLCIESMKIQHIIKSPIKGVINQVNIKPGSQASEGQTLILMS